MRKRKGHVKRSRDESMRGHKPILVDFRKEFGVEGFELPPKELLAMCEEIYQARMRHLKWSNETCAPGLAARTNDAIVAARTALDPCPERAL